MVYVGGFSPMVIALNDDLRELVDQLERTTQLPRGLLARLVGDVLGHYDEGVDAFVRRRHAELQVERMSNPVIWDQLSSEIALRRFTADALSPRQLRRIVYG